MEACQSWWGGRDNSAVKQSATLRHVPLLISSNVALRHAGLRKTWCVLCSCCRLHVEKPKSECPAAPPGGGEQEASTLAVEVESQAMLGWKEDPAPTKLSYHSGLRGKYLCRMYRFACLGNCKLYLSWVFILFLFPLSLQWFCSVLAQYLGCPSCSFSSSLKLRIPSQQRGRCWFPSQVSGCLLNPRT